MEPATVAVIFGAVFAALAYKVYKLVTTKKDNSARDARNAALPKAPDDNEGDPASGGRTGTDGVDKR